MAEYSGKKADKTPSEFLMTAMKRFQKAEDAEKDVRQKCLEDLRFSRGEQWPDQIRTVRQNDNRPCLTFNRLNQAIRQVTNDERQNRPQIHVIPTKDGDEDTARILEGLMRQIQVSSEAGIAYDTACDHQVRMGFGFFRVCTRYVDEQSFDQEIIIDQIKNPFTVFVDPNAQQPDYSDAKYMFITCDMDRDEFERTYPDALAASIDKFEGVGNAGADWLGKDSVRVAEYFYVKEEYSTLYQMQTPDGQSVTMTKQEREAAEEAGFVFEEVNKRDICIKQVKWAKITATDVLEEQDWPGQYIPIIPVLGDDYIIDDKRNVSGMTRDAKDSQQMYNFWNTAQTEAIALAPKAPFVIAEGQFEGYETFWQTANLKSYSYLPYKPTSIEGTPVPPPQRQTAEPPVQAMVQAIQMAGDNIKATTGIYDAGLGSRSNETSGKAIMARQREGDVANFHFIDNLGRSIRHAGRVILDLIPKIYDVARIIRVVKEDNKTELVKVNQPIEEKGMQKVYDLTTGKYDVAVVSGPSYTTKRQEAAEAMVQLVQAQPQLMNVIGDIMISQMDWPESQRAAARMKKTLPPELQDDDDEKQPVPPQAAAQMGQMQQMIDQLTKTLNAAQDKMDSKIIELQSKEKIEAMKLQADLIKKAAELGGQGNKLLLDAEIAQLQRKEDVLQVQEQQRINTMSVDNTVPQMQNDITNLQQQPAGQMPVGG